MAIGLLVSMFGVRIAALYIVAGLVVAVVAGWVLGRLRVQRWVEPFVFEKPDCTESSSTPARA